MKSALVLLATLALAKANSSGGSETCCVDMVPKHPVDAQKSPFASTGYSVHLDKNSIGESDVVHLTLHGQKPFKGYLLQVRDGDKAVGTFDISQNDPHSKTINCFTKQKNMATHNNAEDKRSVTVAWKPPKGVKKIYTVYATVAQNGGVFWVRQPTSQIQVN